MVMEMDFSLSFSSRCSLSACLFKHWPLRLLLFLYLWNHHLYLHELCNHEERPFGCNSRREYVFRCQMEISVHQKQGFSRTRLCRHPGAVFSMAPALPPGWYCPQSAGPPCLCLGRSPRMPTISETGILLTRLLALLTKHSLIGLSGRIMGSGRETHRFVICRNHIFFFPTAKIDTSPPPHIEFSVPCLEGILQNSRLGVEINTICRILPELRRRESYSMSVGFHLLSSLLCLQCLELPWRAMDTQWMWGGG